MQSVVLCIPIVCIIIIGVSIVLADKYIYFEKIAIYPLNTHVHMCSLACEVKV